MLVGGKSIIFCRQRASGASVAPCMSLLMVSGTNKVCGGGVPYLWDEVEVELKGRSGPNF